MFSIQEKIEGNSYNLIHNDFVSEFEAVVLNWYKEVIRTSSYYRTNDVYIIPNVFDFIEEDVTRYFDWLWEIVATSLAHIHYEQTGEDYRDERGEIISDIIDYFSEHMGTKTLDYLPQIQEDIFTFLNSKQIFFRYEEYYLTERQDFANIEFHNNPFEEVW